MSESKNRKACAGIGWPVFLLGIDCTDSLISGLLLIFGGALLHFAYRHQVYVK